MKLLRIVVEGLPVFKNPLDLSFYAQQRVNEEDKEILYPLFSNIYLNCSNVFIGINAAGKTSVLKVIILVLNLLNNQPVNHIETKDILGKSKEVTINVWFCSYGNEIYRLETVITSDSARANVVSYRIIRETLWVRKANSVNSRKNLTDFSGCEPAAVRGEEEFLPDDISIIIAHNKKCQDKMDIASLLSTSDINMLPFSGRVPGEIVTFLDPTVENLYFDRSGNKTSVSLKFRGKAAIQLKNPLELERYLSAGTVKGIIVFTMAREIMKSGGYLIIDEIENHFNKEIASTLIRFFMDVRLNKFGATMIYTTHYPELLDEYDRSDSIYIVRNEEGITAQNLSCLLQRSDIKKSEAYQSGYLGGTAPMYESYMRLKNSIEQCV